MGLLCFPTGLHKGAPNTISLCTGCFVLGFGVRQHSQARGSSGTYTHMHAHTHPRVSANVSVVISWWSGIHLLALRLFGRYGCVPAFGLFKVERMTRHAVRS